MPSLDFIPLLVQIIVACLLGGLLSIAAALAVMIGLPRRYLPMAVSFAAGTLLATALLNLLPEALETSMRTGLNAGMMPKDVFPLLLGGILGFFALERFTFWRHAHHHDDCPHTAEQVKRAPMILIGDAFHNFTDGVLIAAAFLADPALGWATTMALVAHEVPQEAGDFALLLASGWGRQRALFWNGMSSMANIIGGVLGYYLLANAQSLVPVALTLAAAGFIYIAVSDLLPRLRGEQAGIPIHIVLIGCGVAFVVLTSGHAHVH
jgi:zinc and cadmium transporter